MANQQNLTDKKDMNRTQSARNPNVTGAGETSTSQGFSSDADQNIQSNMSSGRAAKTDTVSKPQSSSKDTKKSVEH